jgi:hypothetical protein
MTRAAEVLLVSGNSEALEANRCTAEEMPYLLNALPNGFVYPIVCRP